MRKKKIRGKRSRRPSRPIPQRNTVIGSVAESERVRRVEEKAFSNIFEAAQKLGVAKPVTREFRKALALPVRVAALKPARLEEWLYNLIDNRDEAIKDLGGEDKYDWLLAVVSSVLFVMIEQEPWQIPVDHVLMFRPQEMKDPHVRAGLRGLMWFESAVASARHRGFLQGKSQ